MILKINVLHHYSSKFGNSQQQFTVTDGGVNTIPPIQQNPTYNGFDENNGYGIQLRAHDCDELQHHNQEKLERRA